MADPLTYVGAAASVAGVLDILARCITTVAKFAEQLKDANLAFTSLRSQLLILRGALVEVQDWAESTNAEDAYHQLTIDLDSILLCCRSLVSRLETQLVGLGRDSTGRLTALAKVKLVLGGKNIGEIQKMIAQQVGALNLLLTACNSNTLLEQKQLLQKKSTRVVFRVVERDSASLIVHRDANSFQSAATDNLSKLSRLFGFDDELLSSKVYERAWRSTIRLTLRLEKTTRPDRTTVKRYEQVGGCKPEFKILLLGSSPSSKSTLLKQMKLCWIKQPLALSSGPFTESERMQWKPVILENICSYVWAANERCKDSGSIFSAQVQSYMDEIESLYDQVRDHVRSENDLPQGCFRPFHELSRSEEWREKLLTWPSDGMNFPYFMDHLDRIFSPGYIPSCLDLLNARLRTIGITETRFDHDGHEYRVYDVGGRRSERKKWIHCFENVDIILFQVNLGTYDEVLVEDSEQNQLKESLALFQSIRDSHWFRKTSMFLTFTKMDVFERKISRGHGFPPKELFPYEGDPTDVIAVRESITSQFLDGSKAHGDILVSYIDATETLQAQRLLQTVCGVAKERAKERRRRNARAGV
ncbi:putative guanine nucleotide-binding protein alpha-2 subunit [Rhypophila decipiens]|uniref:Guanine nucleotide-binding protein alpha-2 subunit n=1 Tax=Rhypophila decipiens TaxID=261697 RepID=A0AAN6XUN3_9PEZI|nr:putative guanine nucleotide-binding protein alpha-2 subunit [Rhypophila decipiens]